MPVPHIFGISEKRSAPSASLFPNNEDFTLGDHHSQPNCGSVSLLRVWCKTDNELFECKAFNSPFVPLPTGKKMVVCFPNLVDVSDSTYVKNRTAGMQMALTVTNSIVWVTLEAWRVPPRTSQLNDSTQLPWTCIWKRRVMHAV